MALLTTITPSVWFEQQILNAGIKPVGVSYGASVNYGVKDAHSEVRHLVEYDIKNQFNIGDYHNKMVESVSTEWVMKLDVDCIPSPQFFDKLLPLLRSAKENQWFNAGVFYLKQSSDVPGYDQVLANPRLYTNSNRLPQGNQFICRRSDYLKIGGTDSRFQGYGWEDYSIAYALERNELVRDPLEGEVTPQNVVTRCREEISKPKARQLFELDPQLALLHIWHEPRRDLKSMERNRSVLYEYIMEQKRENVSLRNT